MIYLNNILLYPNEKYTKITVLRVQSERTFFYHYYFISNAMETDAYLGRFRQRFWIIFMNDIHSTYKHFIAAFPYCTACSSSFQWCKIYQKWSNKRRKYRKKWFQKSQNIFRYPLKWTFASLSTETYQNRCIAINSAFMVFAILGLLSDVKTL